MYAQKPVSHAIEIVQTGVSTDGKSQTVTLELGDRTADALAVFDKIRHGTGATRRGYANLYAIVPLPNIDLGTDMDERYMQIIVAQHTWESE